MTITPVIRIGVDETPEWCCLSLSGPCSSAPAAAGAASPVPEAPRKFGSPCPGRAGTAREGYRLRPSGRHGDLTVDAHLEELPV